MSTTQPHRSFGKTSAGKLAAVLMILSLLLMGSASTTQAQAAVPFNLNQTVPLYMSEYIPCAANGAGERVDFTGWMMMSIHGIWYDAGSVNFTAVAVLQGVTGVGRTTGAEYRVVGTDTRINNYGPDRAESLTYTNHFVFIGPEGNYMVLTVYHEVIPTNDGVEDSIERIQVECR